MSIDQEMEEILQLFFEESFEGLDTMESGLLTLDNSANRETINTIFRAAHSIKGGAGTFGFMEISGFTHSVETLLDEMRNGTRGITPDALQVLLQSVDANEVFVALPEATVAALERQGFAFYRWPLAAPGAVAIRLVTSYATPQSQVDEFLAAAQGAARG